MNCDISEFNYDFWGVRLYKTHFCDIIINTIPFQILDTERLDLVKQDVVIVDLASNPGGVDRKAAREKGLKVIWALSLPAKVAPLTSAEFIKETLYHVLKEI